MIIINCATGKNVSGIYAIENVLNNKIYIGRASCLYNRIHQHKQKLKMDRHCNKYLQKSWNKYGESSFIFKIVEKCTREQLSEKEEYYINFYNSHLREFGYNIGSFLNGVVVVSEETRLKISKARKGIVPIKALVEMKRLTLEGKHPNLGKTPSLATRNKMSSSAKGRVPKKAHLKTQQLIKEGKNPYLGRLITKETIAKMLEKKSKWTNEEKRKHFENMSNSLKSRLFNGQEKKCVLINAENIILGEYMSVKELVEVNSNFNFNLQIVRRICNGSRKSKFHKNHTFQFI